jgi:hypothetical protein
MRTAIPSIAVSAAFGKPITLKGLIGPVQQGDVVDRLRRVRDPVECRTVIVVGAGGAGLRHDPLQLGPVLLGRGWYGTLDRRTRRTGSQPTSRRAPTRR